MYLSSAWTDWLFCSIRASSSSSKLLSGIYNDVISYCCSRAHWVHPRWS